jgi:outer membrane protein OmpA-like peptidoglycan-associated protein
VHGVPGAAGYPVTVAYARPVLTVSGLVPDIALKDEVEKAVHAAVPGVVHESRLIALPDTAKVDELQRELTAALAKINEPAAARIEAVAPAGSKDQALSQALARLESLDKAQGQFLARLDTIDRTRGQSAARLDKLEQALAQPVAQTGAPDRALGLLVTRLDGLDKLQAQTAARLDALDQGRTVILTRLDDLDRGRTQFSARLDGLIGPRKDADTDARLQSLTKELSALSAGLQERGPARAATVAEASSADQSLAAWAARNAVFFSEGAEFRNPEQVRKQMDELKGLLAGPDVRLRIIGYTDPLGDQGNNNRLALERAKAVADELGKLGVPMRRLVLAGRAKQGLIASDQGPESANRRVEFQLTFENE